MHLESGKFSIAKLKDYNSRANPNLPDRTTKDFWRKTLMVNDEEKFLNELE